MVTSFLNMSKHSKTATKLKVKFKCVGKKKLTFFFPRNWNHFIFICHILANFHTKRKHCPQGFLFLKHLSNVFFVFAEPYSEVFSTKKNSKLLEKYFLSLHLTNYPKCLQNKLNLHLKNNFPKIWEKYQNFEKSAFQNFQYNKFGKKFTEIEKKCV